MKKPIILIISLLLPLAVQAEDESAFYTGLWEYTIDVRMQAMPQSELKKVQKCIKELNEVISLFKPGPACSISDVKVGPARLNWKLNCKTSGGTYQGDAKLEGNEHALHGRVDMQTIIPGMKNVLRTSYVITGTNKGPCQ